MEKLRLLMRFRIDHRTVYRYAGTASESFMEARLTPTSNRRQKLLSRKFSTTPACNVHSYTDYFGNAVETFSIVQRHRELIVRCESEVETLPADPPAGALEITISEARQVYNENKLELFEFLRPSPAIELDSETHRLATQFFSPGASFGPALLKLNSWIKGSFRYAPGSTKIDTPVSAVLKNRAGVCQDFAQVMIAVLRSASIPARYVTGYIETETQRKASEAQRPVKLIGASESHAWVEV